MKKLSYLIVLAIILGLVLSGCSLLSNISQVPATEQSGITYLTKGGPTENEADEYILYAGQNIPVGTVNVWNDSEILYVQYVVDDPWEMTGSHLYVGKTDPVDFPSTPGQFPYSPGMEKSPSPNASYNDTTMTYTIPLAEIYEYEFVGKGQGKGLNAIGSPGVEPCNEIYIAAQAEVFRSYELVNPGAEDGMNDWNYTIGVVRAIESRAESTGIVLPRSGGYFFDMSESPATHAEMSQGVSVAGFDGTSFNANCWIQTEYGDYGELVLTFKDGLDVELASFTTGPIGNPVSGTGPDGYAQFSFEGNIPDGAVTAIYELRGALVDGSFINVFYDDLSFEYWQEETAWAEGDNFGKNWATYFTYHIAGLPPTISSEDLAGPFIKDELGYFDVATVNPECGFEYPRVIFNYTIEGIYVLEINTFEYKYWDDVAEEWKWGEMPKENDGSGNVYGFFGPLPGCFPMEVNYGEETTFRINIGIIGTFPVTITLINCDNNEVITTFTAEVVVSPETVLAVGDIYGGGKVAYILQSGDPGYVANEQHGLIAATEDQSTTIIAWITGGDTQTTWVNGVGYGGTSTDYGTGQANTNAMKAQTNYTGGAAKVCDDYTNTETGTGVYSDWYLPSKDELNKLYLNKGTIGGFADDWYWSSSENNANHAWFQNFFNGLQPISYKYYILWVRAVRAF